MKRDTNYWLMGFSVSFGITFLGMMVVLGTVCFISYSKAQRGGTENQNTAALGQGPDTYLPSREERLTILAAGGEKGEEPDTYLLLGFLPDRGKIALCVLPSTTYLEYGGQESTLGRLWRQGGLSYARKGLGDYLGIPIDRCAAVDPEGLDVLLEESGGLFEYDLTADVQGTLGGRKVSMGRGHWQLDGQRILDLLAYSGYQGGERERSDRGALLVSGLISRGLPVFLDAAEGARFQEAALTALETDLSAADCLQRKSAVEFLARLELPAVTAVFLEGRLSRDYQAFYLTGGCKARIGEMFGEAGVPPKWSAEDPADEPVAVQEPVQGERKRLLDSGYPPMQEPGALE